MLRRVVSLMFAVFGVLCLMPALSQADRPVDHGGSGWSHGYVLGRPYKLKRGGVFIKSNETRIQIGEFADDPRYIGESHGFSIGDDRMDLVKKWETLDPNKNYLFRYYHHASLIHPVIQYSSNDFITDIIEISPHLTSQGLEELKKGASSTIGRHGNVDQGVRSGRIVFVERWGYDTVCQVGVNFGGVKNGGDSGSHFDTYAVYSEDVCSYAEKILPLGITVDFSYSKDFVEIWDYDVNIMHSIHPSRASGSIPSNVSGNPVPRNSTPDMDYDTLKKRLLDDPEFLEELKRRSQKR